MPSEVHVPLLGTMNKGTAVAGIGALVVVGGYWLYKRASDKKKAAAATSAGSQYGYGGAGAYGYGTYGYGTNTGYYGYGYGGGYGYGLAASEYAGQLAGQQAFAYGYYGQQVQQQQQTPQTNAEWSQDAITQLANQGVDTSTALAALGQYLLGHQLTQAQQSTVESAIAVEGYPPQPGANGYPPAINTGTGGGGGGQGGGGTVQVPNVIGQNLESAIRVIENAGLKEHTTTRAAYGNPGNWVVAGQNPAGGKVKPGTTINVSAKRKR